MNKIMKIYSWIMGHTEIIGLVIDFLAFIATIVLSIAIYLLERRHEKEREKAEEYAQKSAIVEAAKVFLIDNDEEIEYLPLAEIAAKLKLRRKHIRNLLTRYLRCSEQLQPEILHQANIPDIQASTNNVNYALKCLQADFEKYAFGRNILYDGAKYLHRAFECWANIPIEDVDPCIFENLQTTEWYDKDSKIPWRVANCNTTLSAYMYDYFNSGKIGVDRHGIQPPIDMVFQKCDLGGCEESIMTFWTMRIIIDACHTIVNPQYEDVFDESLIQTQEDMYYYTLAVLCKTYPMRSAE